MQTSIIYADDQPRFKGLEMICVENPELSKTSHIYYKLLVVSWSS